MPAREALLAECDSFVAEHKLKADRNERRARVATALLTLSTAAIPVLIIVSTETQDFLFGKLLPAILAALGATVAAWLQFERPHERWALYRRYQRLFEAERFLYLQGAGEYAENDADRAFSEWLARRRIAVHDEWAGLVPASERVANALTDRGGG